MLSDMMRQAGQPISAGASFEDDKSKSHREAARQLLKDLDLDQEKYEPGLMQMFGKMKDTEISAYIAKHKTADKVFRKDVLKTIEKQGFHIA